MWLVTTQGFYSVVADRDDPHRVLVRARTRADIEALGEQIPDLDPFEDPEADYRWRAFIDRADWERAVVRLTEEIDYPNFKARVCECQGPERAARYEELWWKLRALQD